MERPKIEHYGKHKMTDSGVETVVSTEKIMEYVKDLETYCNYLENKGELLPIDSVSGCNHDFKPCKHEAVQEFDECIKCGEIV